MPTNERVNSNYADIDIMEVVRNGLEGLPAKYIPSNQWITHVEESNFRYDHSALEHLPTKIRKNAHGQLGTLGSGNHFCEIQYLEIAEEHKELAAKWGTLRWRGCRDDSLWLTGLGRDGGSGTHPNNLGSDAFVGCEKSRPESELCADQQP